MGIEPQTFLALALACLGGTGFWSFVQMIYRTKSKKKSAEGEALLAILHDMIYPALEVVVTRPGEIVGYEEMDRIRRLYEPYKKLGGNGTVESRFKIAEAYRRVPDEVIYRELEIKT